MLSGETHNVKDSSNFTDSIKDGADGQGLAIKDTSFSITYSKTNKLIAGLYMVTDILDKDEPIRFKLRTLGASIISDIYLAKQIFNGQVVTQLLSRVQEILSFLDIGKTVGIISEMNGNILQKEFFELKNSIEEARNSMTRQSIFAGKATLSEFLKQEEIEAPLLNGVKQNPSSNGHVAPTRIGVQKGHSLMKALSDRMPGISGHGATKENFDFLKKERRYQITKIIQHSTNGATVTDIKKEAQGALATCGEKTLQRELISMLKDGVLKKTGEKRWSRYFLAN